MHIKISKVILTSFFKEPIHNDVPSVLGKLDVFVLMSEEKS